MTITHQPIVRIVTETQELARVKNFSRKPNEYGRTPSDDERRRLQKYRPLHRRNVSRTRTTSSTTLYQEMAIKVTKTIRISFSSPVNPPDIPSRELCMTDIDLLCRQRRPRPRGQASRYLVRHNRQVKIEIEGDLCISSDQGSHQQRLTASSQRLCCQPF